MAKTSIWIEGEGKKQKIIINQFMKAHRINIQQAMATAMGNTRKRAHDLIIPNMARNKTGGKIRNPRAASRKQPSTAGRLTSRTGKLKYMLRNSTGSGSTLKGWTGFGSINAKQQSVAFKTQIKAQRISGKREIYTGTIRVYVTGDSYLFNTKGGMPRESLRTLAIRFNWETGIRGSTRPIFKPAYSATEFDMRRLVELKDANIRRNI